MCEGFALRLSSAFLFFFSKSRSTIDSSPVFLRPQNLFLSLSLFLFLSLPKLNNNDKKTATSSSPPAAASFSAHAFSLPHPRTGKDVQYLLHRSRRTSDETTHTSSTSVVVSLLEASRFAPSHGSWFYGGEGDGESVCSDPGVLLLTEIDPLFVALPALDSARALMSEQRRTHNEGEEDEENSASNGGGRFVDAEAAVCGGERGEDSGKRAAAALALLVALAGGRGEEEGGKEQDTEMAPSPSSPSSSSPPPLTPPSPRSRARSNLLRAAGEALSSVCEVKTVGGDRYFRLCERRTRAWLRLKAGAAAAVLKQRGGPAFAGLEGEALEAAGGALIAEWLPREWSEKMGWPCPGGAGNSAAAAARPASASAAAAKHTPATALAV